MNPDPKRKPIYLQPADMVKRPAELMKEIRAKLTQVRGELHDVKFAFGWNDRIATAEEGLTLVISYLYGVIEEMKEVDSARAKEMAGEP